MSRRAFVTPDERTWLLWGRDLRAEGFDPVPAPAGAAAMIVPAQVPPSVLGPLEDAWSELASPRDLVPLQGPLDGRHVTSDLLDHGEHVRDGHENHGEHHGGHEDHGEHHDGHGGHSGHDHHAMMAVTGDPSSDGLVMEDLDFTLGPLSPVLPAGLVAAIRLDGDVVCEADLVASFHAPVGDPTTPRSWRVAQRAHEGDLRRSLIDIELERALSHATWAMSLGTVLGWEQLAGRARTLARRITAIGADVDRQALGRADEAARSLLSLADGGRRLRFRLSGLAVVDHGDVERLALAGPIARASGVPRDARTRDDAYRALGFQPILRDEGDALARTLVRLEEIVASLSLVARAIDAARGGDQGSLAVEAPRGELDRNTAGEAVEVRDAGARGALEIAGECLAGLEWSAFVAGLTSFDLPGWRTG